MNNEITMSDVLTGLDIIDCNHIYEGLYQGACPPAGRALREAGFDVVVLTAKENQLASMYDDIEVICAPGDDDTRVHRMNNFLPSWKQAASLTAQHVKNGKKVLVTCMQGLNRSGIVTAMALHELTGWPGEKCVRHISERRVLALCNLTFATYICENYR